MTKVTGCAIIASVSAVYLSNLDTDFLPLSTRSLIVLGAVFGVCQGIVSAWWRRTRRSAWSDVKVSVPGVLGGGLLATALVSDRFVPVAAFVVFVVFVAAAVSQGLTGVAASREEV